MYFIQQKWFVIVKQSSIKFVQGLSCLYISDIFLLQLWKLPDTSSCLSCLKIPRQDDSLL